ncbi:MAG: hypothetical protein P4L39_00725 [Humidesulfovibrio sp.]|nr:hypothetical protein [Humidesulfovibrio sp.]
MRRDATILALPLLALLTLPACNRPTASQDAQIQELRDRVAHLEHEGDSERARLAEDLSAMREDVNALHASLDEANQRLAALSGEEPAATANVRPHRSAHAALRQSLHEMFNASRNALDRLGKGLDRTLHRTQDRNATDAPAN